MKISEVHEVRGGKKLFKIFVFDESGNKFGEFEFSNKTRADEFRKFLEKNLLPPGEVPLMRKWMNQS